MQRSHRLRFAVPLLLLTGILTTVPDAHAQVHVYVTSSENVAADTALVNLLTSFGHTVTLGVPYHQLNGTQSLAGIQTVYFQTNYNWVNVPSLDTPVAGQTALVNFVNNGGGLVTNEWTLWKTTAQGVFTTLSPLFAVDPTTAFDGAATGLFSQTTANATLNAGLPASFTTALESISGTETHFTTLRPGAVSYYSNNGLIGLAGITAGAGRVLNFNTVNGQGQVADPNFGRLLSNSMNLAANGTITSAAAPEPGTLALLGMGILPLVGMAARHRRRKAA